MNHTVWHGLMTAKQQLAIDGSTSDFTCSLAFKASGACCTTNLLAHDTVDGSSTAIFSCQNIDNERKCYKITVCFSSEIRCMCGKVVRTNVLLLAKTSFTPKIG
jgi:hypothetical protein